MKELVILTREGCPYCGPVRDNINKVLEKRPEYSSARITFMDENDERAQNLDHYYAPAFFSGTVRISEGDGSEEAVIKAFEELFG